MNKAKMFRSGVDMTQDEMADALGISRVSYANKETGKADWTLKEMKTFVSVINEKSKSNLTLDDIFFD